MKYNQTYDASVINFCMITYNFIEYERILLFANKSQCEGSYKQWGFIETE